MPFHQAELGTLVKAHYGKALKKENRDDAGVFDVYGSSGQVGFHIESICDYPTLVVGRKGSVGDIVWAPKGGWVIDTAYFLEILNPGILDLRYLFYALKRANLANKTITTSIPGLNRDDFYETKISLPPLAEQKRIAAILDKADSLRRKNQQAIHLADQFLRAVFLDMFGDPVTNPKKWEVKSLGRSVRFQGGYAFKSTDYQTHGIRLVKIANVHFGSISWNEVDCLPEEYKQKYNDFLLNENDLVMAMTRPIIKSLDSVKLVTMSKADVPSLLNQRVGRFVDYKENLTREYLEYFIYTDYFKSMVEKFSSSALQPNISSKQVESIEMIHPPKNLQLKFSKLVNRIKSVRIKEYQGLCDAETLFNSLSQKAFAGEL